MKERRTLRYTKENNSITFSMGTLVEKVPRGAQFIHYENGIEFILDSASSKNTDKTNILIKEIPTLTFRQLIDFADTLEANLQKEYRTTYMRLRDAIEIAYGNK